MIINSYLLARISPMLRIPYIFRAEGVSISEAWPIKEKRTIKSIHNWVIAQKHSIDIRTPLFLKSVYKYVHNFHIMYSFHAQITSLVLFVVKVCLIIHAVFQICLTLLLYL